MRRLYIKSNPNPSQIKTYRYLANRFPDPWCQARRNPPFLYWELLGSNLHSLLPNLQMSAQAALSSGAFV